MWRMNATFQSIVPFGSKIRGGNLDIEGRLLDLDRRGGIGVDDGPEAVESDPAGDAQEEGESAEDGGKDHPPHASRGLGGGAVLLGVDGLGGLGHGADSRQGLPGGPVRLARTPTV